jgi:pSer/pThr/pTyr-binding forkhead associated (FHA) protein
MTSAPKQKHLLLRPCAEPLELRPGTSFTLGRDPTCFVSIPSPRVSRIHAEVTWWGAIPVIEDKGSQNGTFVNRKRIVKPHPLASRDEIEIGPFSCVYEFGTPRTNGSAVLTSSQSGEALMNTCEEGTDLLTGQISENGLAEVVQGLEFNAKTGTLAVFSREGDGTLFVERGNPIFAEAKGGLKDEEALFFLLGRKQGSFTFTFETKETERRIKRSITALLLDWGRIVDEQAKQP